MAWNPAGLICVKPPDENRQMKTITRNEFPEMPEREREKVEPPKPEEDAAEECAEEGEGA